MDLSTPERRVGTTMDASQESSDRLAAAQWAVKHRLRARAAAGANHSPLASPVPSTVPTSSTIPASPSPTAERLPAEHVDEFELRELEATELAHAPVEPAEAARATNLASEQRNLVKQLANEVRKLELSDRKTTADHVISTGCEALDDCLPNSGYLPGSVIEYLRASPACGASYLAFAAAASAMQKTAGFLVIVDHRHCIYPPALTAHGIDLAKVVLVRPDTAADALWSVDQALRTPAVAAVVAEMERVDDRAARRLQLAAENGDGLALLLRSAAARHHPSWAEVQWLVQAAKSSDPVRPLLAQRLGSFADSAASTRMSSRGLHVQLIRNRGGRAGTIQHLEINGITGRIQAAASRERNRHEQKVSVRLATELASPKNPSRRTSAG